LYFNRLGGKKEQAKPKISKRKEIVKFRAKIDEIESKKDTKRDSCESFW
jgi:hypothetical protein